MALILNIETATEICSVALAKDGEVLFCSQSSEPQAHAAQLTVLIHVVIKSAGLNFNLLDAIAVSKGPGSYTGLRIGVSAAKGLCFALDKPLLSVNTLLSFSTYFKVHYLLNSGIELDNDLLLCPMLDARRMEVYTAVFNQHFETIEPTKALILDESSFDNLLSANRIVYFGSGATKWQQLAHTHTNALFVKGCETSAKGMVNWSEKLYNSGVYEDLAYFEPYYLKDFISSQPRKKFKI